MDKYNVIVSRKALYDFKRIIRYIKDSLREPRIAEKYARLITTRINSLEYYPYRYEIINSRYEKYKDIRRFMIDNYVALYGVNEEKKEVNILRILYAGSDWLEK